MFGYGVQTIYYEYSDDVYRYLLSLCRDPVAAEDLLQATFLQVVKGVATFRGECAVKTWLFTIARHEYFRWKKKNPPMEELSEKHVSKENTEAVCERQDEAQRLLVLIENMKEPHRSLMILRLANDYSFKDIGTVLGKSETWARVNFMRTKIKLIKTLQEE